jgi:phosphoribosylaminoimidazole-succinocarboxamide synthase
MTELTGWTPVYSGKVRELYIPQTASTVQDGDKLLIVATNRVSAFDHILTPEIPGKGAILTSLTRWWFTQLSDVPNHLSGEDPPQEIADRAMVVEPLEMFPVECVVRGYLAGSGWREYQATSRVCGVELPPGLSEGDDFPSRSLPLLPRQPWAITTKTFRLIRWQSLLALRMRHHFETSVSLCILELGILLSSGGHPG